MIYILKDKTNAKREGVKRKKPSLRIGTASNDCLPYEKFNPESSASGKKQWYNYILPFAESFASLASALAESLAAFIVESIASFVESIASTVASLEESIALTVESVVASVDVPLLHDAKAPIAKTTKSFFIVVSLCE